jgi:hypothetical protein
MRGISPELLVSQVRNTAPYVFYEDPASAPDVIRSAASDGMPVPAEARSADVIASPPAVFVREYDREKRELSHFEYFRLCLSAHYLTCATPVPTDVDNQIRRKLWASGLPLATALEMAQLVLESHGWDFTPLTSRASYGAAGTEWERVPLSGHLGEWFTVACGAYAALGHYRAQDAKKLRGALLEAIAEETDRHSEVFGSLLRAKDGLGALRASASIAHNFGDLDRVVEAWDVPFADPLRLRFHRLTLSAFGPERELRYQGRLWTAGQLYKSVIDGSSIALENHRHFALRKPRALRSLPVLRIPLGPFLDDWGAEVARTLSGESLLDVIDALVHGSQRSPATVGYARALHAIEQVKPEVSERADALRETPRLRARLATSREDFESRWSAAALAHLDDIPSRA